MTMDNEIWEDIPGYGGRYQVSNLGRVKTRKSWDVNMRTFVDTDKEMTPFSNGRYLVVCLRSDRKRKNHYVHRLVATAFVDNPKSEKCVNHIDYNPMNNRADNLEWCSQRENVLYSAHRMRHRNKVPHSNTGEMYISQRKSNGVFRVAIDGKELKSFHKLSDAISFRDSVLKGVI